MILGRPIAADCVSAHISPQQLTSAHNSPRQQQLPQGIQAHRGLRHPGKYILPTVHLASTCKLAVIQKFGIVIQPPYISTIFEIWKTKT